MSVVLPDPLGADNGHFRPSIDFKPGDAEAKSRLPDTETSVPQFL